MQFTTGADGVYLAQGDMAVNLTSLSPEIGHDLTAIISGHISLDECAALAQKGEAVARAGITPALPVARPGKFICLGLNYLDHIKEGGNKVPDYPVLFMRGQTSLVASGQPMILPRASEQLDYEAELLVVIGKTGKHLTVQKMT